MFRSRTSSRSLWVTVAAIVVARTATNGSWRVVYPFVGQIAEGLGVGLATVGLLLFVRSATALIAPGVPRIIDRTGHRRVMLAAPVVVVAGSAVLVATQAVPAGWWALVAAGAGFAVLGLAKPLLDVGLQGWLGARVPPERRGRVLGITELAWGLALALAFPAAWLIVAFGWTAMFWLVAAVALVGVAGLAATVPRRDPAVPTPARLPLSDLRGPLGVLLAVVVLYRLAAELLFVVYGPWLEADLGLAVTAVGAFTLIVVASELVGEGAVAAVGDRVGLRRSVLIGLIGTTAAYASLGLVGGSLVAAIAAVVAWFVLFEITIVATIPLAIGLAHAQRERLLSLIVTIDVGSMGLGALLGPALFSAAGIWLNGLVAAGCTAVATALVLARVPAPSVQPS